MKWQKEQIERFILFLSASYLLGAFALLVVLLAVDLTPDDFSEVLTLCFVLAVGGPLFFFLGGKEAFMRIEIVERVKERRRVAAAAALMERYDGIDLMSTPEAVVLPTPIYECGGCGHSYKMTADRMYWVDEQPMLSAGWYCDDCVDKLEGKSRHERLNMEIFLIMLDSDIGTD